MVKQAQFKAFFWLLFVFSLLFASVSHANSTVVSKVRLGQNGEVTRVVLESDKPLNPEYFTLPNPPRFVLDFPKSTFKVNVDGVDLPEKSLVKGLREGLFQPYITRMVVDLTRPATAKVFNLPPIKGTGHRLVIDLTPSTSAQMARQERVEKPRLERAPAEVFEIMDKKKNEVVVVLDPGHGGVDPGAIGQGKTYEKHVVLEIAKRLKTELEKNPNIKVFMTRDRDIFVPLQDRVRFAQRKKADLFVSIHADAHNDRSIKGGSVYVLSNRASDREASRLAQHANRGDLVAGIQMKDEISEVQNILIDLTQRETMNKSAMLASTILKNMGRDVLVRKNEVAFAGFRVLTAPEIPSVLVEVTYISNTAEERRLRDRGHQQRIARTLSTGIQEYINNHRLN